MEEKQQVPESLPSKITEFKEGFKNVRVETRTWNTLKSLKTNENDTFDDVIKNLLQQRTINSGNENIKLITYGRKTAFFEVNSNIGHIGIEAEYNDVKSNKNEFTLDVKIKKVFHKKRIYNASEFFGVDNEHKHYSSTYLTLYLRACALALKKEFRAYTTIGHKDYDNIAIWRKLYYEHSLSEDSFSRDIEKPLRLSEQETPNEHYKKLLQKAPATAVEYTI